MKILGFDYKLIASPIKVDEANFFGRHNGGDLTIKVLVEAPLQQQESSLLHEIFESINWRLGLKMEERDMLALETGMYQVLKDAGVDLGPLMKELRNGA